MSSKHWNQKTQDITTTQFMNSLIIDTLFGDFKPQLLPHKKEKVYQTRDTFCEKEIKLQEHEDLLYNPQHI